MSRHFNSLALLTVGTLGVWLMTSTAQATPSGTESLAVPNSEVAVGALQSSELGGLTVETFQWPDTLGASLTDVAVDQSVILQGFPVAPGERLRVQLRRYDLYAAEGSVHVLDDGAPARRASRSQRLFFRGFSVDAPELRLAVSLHPRGGELRGTVQGPDGRRYEILAEPTAPSLGSTRHLIRDVLQAEQDAGVELEARCGSDALPLPATHSVAPSTAASPLPQALLQRPARSGSSHLRGTAASLGEPTWSAIVAVDTDNEINDLKFGNSITTATDYIADLFNEMNLMYERDLSLRLLIGDTFLRRDLDIPPTYNDDPYDNLDSPASGAALNEFGAHWQSNMSSVERVFAMLLSGKSAASNSASGIAWIDGYCESQSTGGGYSVNQIFRGNFPIINDARLVGHELGHNHGSPHTHCYNPPVDECSSIGTGCYDGSNGFNCPPEGPGTVMSYCNFSASSCGQNRLEFHPRVITNLDLFILAHTPTCIEFLTDPESLFTDGFESGNTSAWAATEP